MFLHLPRTLNLFSWSATKGEGCPIGTVSIRRTTRNDLIRAKLHSQMYALKINPLTESELGTHVIIISLQQQSIEMLSLFFIIIFLLYCFVRKVDLRK